MRQALAIPATCAFATFCSPVLANPNQSPDILAMVGVELGNEFRVSHLVITAEDLRRDGLDANYYSEFEASVVLPVSLYYEVSHGDGYLLLGKLYDRGTTISAFGNAIGAYQDGRWLVDVNVLDFQLSGGRPFSEYRSRDIVVLESGTDLVAQFLAQREAALDEARALRLQEVQLEDAKLRLEEELRLEREVLTASREGAALAAAELAKVEAEQKMAAERGRLIAQREAELQAADEKIFSLLNTNATYRAEVTHRKRRVQGTLEIVASGENHASGALTVALGNGESYQAPFTITSAREAGHVVARYKWFDDFDRDIDRTSARRSAFSAPSITFFR